MYDDNYLSSLYDRISDPHGFPPDGEFALNETVLQIPDVGKLFQSSMGSSEILFEQVTNVDHSRPMYCQ